MSSNCRIFTKYKKLFSTFGLQPFQPIHYRWIIRSILLFTPVLVQVGLLTWHFTSIWLCRSEIIYDDDEVGRMSDWILFTVTCIYHTTIFSEIVLNFSCFGNIERHIHYVRIMFEQLSSTPLDYMKFIKNYTRKFVSVIIFWLIGEYTFYFHNCKREQTKYSIIYYIYILGIKHLRELQILFYLEICAFYLKSLNEIVEKYSSYGIHQHCIAHDANFNRYFCKFIEKIDRTHSEITTLMQVTKNMFLFSLLVLHIQSEIHITKEIYWISFGFVNGNKTDVISWPLSTGLVSKFLLPYLISLNATKCRHYEELLLVNLNKIHFKQSQRTVRELDTDYATLILRQKSNALVRILSYVKVQLEAHTYFFQVTHITYRILHEPQRLNVFGLFIVELPTLTRVRIRF